MSDVATKRILAAIAVAIVVAAQVVLLSHAATGLGSPPPTPVPPNGSLSPFPTRLATPADASVAPQITAASALLADLDSGQVLDAKSANEPRPIASLTKIMTSLLTFERADLDDIVTIDPSVVFHRNDYGADSILGLRAGERESVRDLLYATILGSANDAAEALAIHIAGSQDAFVRMMNARAHALGMRHTVFRSVSGLDDRGRSTVSDLLVLVRAADSTPGFDAITATREDSIPAPAGPDRRIQNRNALLWLYPGAFGTKTGTTHLAGACLVASARRDGRRLVSIVLGAPHEAFSDSAALLNYGFAGFAERTVVAAGDDQGTVAIRGGTVPVVAGATLTALIPVAPGEQVSSRVSIDPTAAFPPSRGQRVGSVSLSVGGLPLGRVPLRVSAVPPPPPSGGAWWVRSSLAIGRALASAVHAVAAT